MSATVFLGVRRQIYKNNYRHFTKFINWKSSASLSHNLATVFFTPSALVNYHLLNSVQCSEAIMAGSVYETAEGSTIEIGCDGDSLTVNGIKMVLKKDIVTTNGVIHLIDQVLIPDSGKTRCEF